MAQRTGALIFDERTDRYDIRFDVSEYYGGLHCGDCFDVFVRGKWKPTRMEMNATGMVSCGRESQRLKRAARPYLNAWEALKAAFPLNRPLPRKEDGKCKMKSTKRP